MTTKTTKTTKTMKTTKTIKAVTPSSPTFGDEMLSQHLRLRLLLRAIDEVLSTPGEQSEGQPLASALVVLATDLHRELPGHFEFEERDGYFLDVARLAPEMSKELDQLKRDHVDLLERSSALLDLSFQVLKRSRRWAEARSAFGALSSRLIKHENKENSIMQDVFSLDIGQSG
ncbi:MAG: hemerythrin domain-containing protein [Deltaproteobacteria bacterium]|nr:hemerythrin domain-containing protein [Deltaproteobacteria bacterium]